MENKTSDGKFENNSEIEFNSDFSGKDFSSNDLINKNSENDILIPVSIFTNGASGLESISKYLKDVLGIRYCNIAGILNRDDRTIWGAHQGANAKSENFDAADSGVKVPVSIFHDRKLSVLEAISEYLKEERSMRFCEIAQAINKNQRTVWTVYSRAKKKRKQNA